MVHPLLIAGLVLFLAGCQPATTQTPAPAPQADAPGPVETLGIDFTSWPAVTEKPHPVAPEVAFFCNVPDPLDSDQWQGEQKIHGPHFQPAIVVRVSPEGCDDFLAGRQVPVGTVVVKEKHWNEVAGTPSAVAVMIKREPGYDPDHGDWEYGYEHLVAVVKSRVVRGKLDSCIDCHTNAQRSDYLFRTYLKPAQKK